MPLHPVYFERFERRPCVGFGAPLLDTELFAVLRWLNQCLDQMSEIGLWSCVCWQCAHNMHQLAVGGSGCGLWLQHGLCVAGWVLAAWLLYRFCTLILRAYVVA